jgi:hypothetical protein
MVAQIQFNNMIENVVSAMGEEKIEFMQQYFANAEFQRFVNERVFRACLRKIAEKASGARAPTDGWGAAVREEDDGAILQAAQPGADDNG